MRITPLRRAPLQAFRQWRRKLREALARNDMDFVLTGPADRKKSTAGQKPQAQKRFLLLHILGYRPARTILGAAFSAVLVGIGVNALFFQTARHPAPLFGSVPVPEARKPVAPNPAASSQFASTPVSANAPGGQVAAPGVAQRQSDQIQRSGDPIGALALGASLAPVTSSKPPSASAAQPQARPRSSEINDIKAARDPIAALIGPSSSSSAAPSEADKTRVQSAQRALIKLGFVLKADGMMGTSTRQAIEKFERDRNIAVTGELTPKTIKELSTQSHIAIP
jgi:hypothetical protein